MTNVKMFRLNHTSSLRILPVMSTILTSHILGLPRVGARREWKFALESFWKGTLDEKGLEEAAKKIRLDNLARQSDAGLDLITVGDFAAYDQVLTNLQRYTGAVSWTEHFRLARGDENSKPWDMTKWFDTNYHYLVPELSAATAWNGAGDDLLAAIDEALATGIPAAKLKAVVLGPVTLLALSKWNGAGTVWNALSAASTAFRRVLQGVAARGVLWVQVDEPVLALDDDEAVNQALRSVYAERLAGQPRLLLATYFGAVDHRRSVIDGLAVDGVHLDLVRGPGQLEGWYWPKGRVLSAGLVDGRNVWPTSREQVAHRLAGWSSDTATWVASSCSLLHVPVDAAQENTGVKLSFAVQKLSEVHTLTRGLPRPSEALAEAVSDHVEPVRRQPEFGVRSKVQAQALQLPLWPTTTIGSFPQTTDLRALRASWKKGAITDDAYQTALKIATADTVRWQEEAGLDVLVHGEFERNDMVESFAELLDGFTVTANGWVQSYGSRCVKPPVISGDVSRPKAMTVEWARYAQSLTSKLMKGMLTGPVTVTQWSFVRDDIPRSEVANQIARALADEVLDLEAAGIRVIQVDEPAFREGLPLRQRDHEAYWAWAVEAFHRTVAAVKPETQIHTHMCYSDFSTCLPQIAALDADVITIETSRSAMALLDDFGRFAYPAAVGPGVWDIHSPRVPTVDEMVDLLARAAKVLPADRLWANPDCGLKTRGWPEVKAGVANLVAAAKKLRAVG
jgi:5-methyltetrahydropteroyltriglutamate--homocysteine methyltransferase